MTRPAPRPVGELRPGYYQTRLVKGGPLVPVELRYGPPLDPVTGEEMDRRPRWMAFLNGELHDDCLFTLTDRDNGDFIWRIAHSHPMTKAEHDHQVQVHRWAREHAPGLPEANPRRSISLGQMKPLF